MVLYPPILNTTQPAFIGGYKFYVDDDSAPEHWITVKSIAKIYFKFPIGLDPNEIPYLNLQAYITKKDGTQILDKNNTREQQLGDDTFYPYKETGIILNIPFYNDNNGYFIQIDNLNFLEDVSFDSDIQEHQTIWQGFIPGENYKFQLRFSTELYPEGATKQATWLQQYNTSFSEWSNCCYIKCIAPMQVNLPIFNFSEIVSNDPQAIPLDPTYIDISSPAKIIGTIISTVPEADELFQFCRIRLLSGNSGSFVRVYEDSGDIYRSETSQTGFEYKFKYNFEENTNYRLELGIVTENEFIGTIEPIYFHVVNENTDTLDNVYVITTESDEDNILDTTWIDKEEDEGRVVLKIVDKNESPLDFSGKICICRANTLDNFSTWEDIKIIDTKDTSIKFSWLGTFSDYTIESGIFYAYGLRLINENGYYGPVFGIALSQKGDRPVLVRREFNYSFILGQGDKQLRLRFDNTIDNYKYQILDSKTETVGSQFAFFGRNANVYYQTFPIKGLISSCMESFDFGTYCTDKFNINGTLYDDDAFIIELTNKYESLYYCYFNMLDKSVVTKALNGQDLTAERIFRQEVLAFLQDGKPKLFKSPTEGNVIVRLMDVQCTPNKTLNRLIYNFSCNAYEFDKNTMENYYKYGLYDTKYVYIDK